MRRRVLLLTLIAVHLGLRFAAWLRPLRQLDDLGIPDDAYLSLHLARSIAHGLGPWYGLAPTNGFQPLYVFLMAPVFLFTGANLFTPVRVALLLLIAADAVALALMMRLALRIGCSTAAVAVAGMTWALASYSLRTSLNGLETSLAAAAILGVVLVWWRVRSTRVGAGSWAALGALTGLAYWARIDSLLVVPALAVALLARSPEDSGGRSRVETLRGLFVAAGVALAVALPWLVYSWRWTHDLYPISGRAVRYTVLSVVNHAPTWSNIYAPMLIRAARALIRNLGIPVSLGLAFAVAANTRSPGAFVRIAARLRPLAPLLAYAMMLIAAYALVVFGPWYFWRYFYPLLVLASLAIAVASDELLATLARHRARATAVILGVVAAASFADPMFRAIVLPGQPPPWGYMRMALWVRDHFPRGTVIGGSQSGALGYFADRQTIVNLDGVVNRDCFDAMRHGRMLGYMRQVGVRYLVWQDDIEIINRESRGGEPDAVTFLGFVPGARSWGDPWSVWRVELRPSSRSRYDAETRGRPPTARATPPPPGRAADER